MQKMIRRPAVAGHFYPGQKRELETAVQALFGGAPSKRTGPGTDAAVVMPHAGYQYSGKVAARTILAADLPSTIILMGPNHTGLGEPFSVMTGGVWQTPLGDVPVYTALAEAIAKNSKLFRADTLAHLQEHALEVMLPFLQVLYARLTIVPIIIMNADLETYRRLAQDMITTMEKYFPDEKIGILASSDMTHYEPHESAKTKDRYAIEAILKLDEAELLERVAQRRITMCGIAPVAVMLAAVKHFGAWRGELIDYQTSGDVTGDRSSVVGYAGIKIT